MGDQFSQMALTVFNELILRQEHEIKCSGASIIGNELPVSTTKSLFLHSCHKRLLTEQGNSNYFILFLKCYDILCSRCESNSNLCEDSCEDSDFISSSDLSDLFSTWDADVEKALLDNIDHITMNVNGLYLHRQLGLKILSLQREICEIVQQNTIISWDDMSSLFDNIHRVQSFYLNVENVRRVDITNQFDPDFFSQLDSDFEIYVNKLFYNQSHRIFQQENDDFFELLFNKISFCRFNSSVEYLFPKSLHALMSIRDAMKATASEAMVNFDASAKAAIGQKLFEDVEEILQKLYIGHNHLHNLLSDFNDIQRVYWDVLGEIKKLVSDNTIAVMSLVSSKPLSEADFVEWLKKGTSDSEDIDGLDELRECLVADGVIDHHGYCNYHWDGTTKTLAASPQLSLYTEVIKKAIVLSRSKCGRESIYVADSTVLDQLTNLGNMARFDSFRVNSSEPILPVTHTLAIVRNEILWRSYVLQSILKKQLSREVFDHSVMEICYEVKQLRALSTVLSLDFNENALTNLIRQDCETVAKMSSEIYHLDVDVFPFKDFHNFFTFKKTFLSFVCDLQIDGVVINLIESSEKAISDLIQRLINVPLMAEKNVLKFDVNFLCSLFSWEFEMSVQAPSLRNVASVLRNFYSVDDADEKEMTSLKSVLSTALNNLMTSIEELISEACDFEELHRKINLMESFIPLGEHLNLPLSKRHSFFFGQLLTLQSTIQEEFKERIVNFDFIGMRDYLEKCNNRQNAAVYKRYTQLMDVVEGVLRQFLKDLQHSNKDASAMNEGLNKLLRVWTAIGGDSNSYDHVKEYCKIDLEEEISKLKRHCNAYMNSLLDQGMEYKGHHLEIAVKAANAVWLYNDQVRFSNYKKSIEDFIEKLRVYLCWNGHDKPSDESFASQVFELASALCSQKSRGTSEGALNVASLSNVLDQIKLMEGNVSAPPVKELINYSFWIRQITGNFKEIFDTLAANADSCGTYSTALNTLKFVSTSFTESFWEHLSEGELQLAFRISKLESALSSFNDSKPSYFESIEGCKKLKAYLDNLKNSRFDNFVPHKLYIFYKKWIPKEHQNEYKKYNSYYQNLVDQLYVDLSQALKDNNLKLVLKKFTALELVNKILSMHLKANLIRVDTSIVDHFNEMLESLLKAIDTKDLIIFKQRFEGFNFYRKLLADNKISINQNSMDQVKKMHIDLAATFNFSIKQFKNMCSQLKFENALNIIDLVKASRQVIDFLETADYLTSFESVTCIVSAKRGKYGIYERITKNVKDETLIALRCAAKSYPELTELSNNVQKLHSTILNIVHDSIANHEYFKLKSISEGLQSFHLLKEFGGGEKLIEATKKSVHDIIRGGLDALRQDVTKHWTNKAWAALNDSIKVLQDAEKELRHLGDLIDTSLMYTIHQDLEKKLTDIGSQAIDIASSTTGDRNERIGDFALKLADLGRVYDEVQEFHNLAKAHICRILNHCRENCGLHFIFRLGVLLEEGAVFGDDSNSIRIGHRLVSDFSHFKDVATMAWNKSVSQIPVDESLKNMECYTYDAQAKQKNAHTFDCPHLKIVYEEFKNKYDQLLVKYLPNGMDNTEIVDEVLKLADTIKSCSLGKWDDSIKQEIPVILAGIFAFYTVSKCGDSFNSIGGENMDDKVDGENSCINAQDILITPHNIQVLTILRLLGCGESSTSLQNHMMQIGTGEGKSIVLGALATIFGILNFPVRCVCYSEYLSSRDYNDFKDIFIAFKCQRNIVYSKITSFSEDSVAKQGNIRQLTQDMILGRKSNPINNSNYGNNDAHVKESRISHEEDEIDMKDDKDDDVKDENDNKNVEETKTYREIQQQSTTQREVLLVDEVDVFFGKDFYGRTYNQVTTICTPEITALIKKIWKERSSKPNLRSLSNTSEYAKLVADYPQWKFLIDNELRLMCSQVNSFNLPPYYYNAQLDQIGYSEHDTISYALTYGYRTLFAYLHEMEKGEIQSAHMGEFEERHLHMQVSCGQFSYANIDPACILGVSGTLQALTEYEKEVMTRYKIKLYSITPSVYGTKQLVFDSPDTGLYVASTKADYFKAIVDIINEMSRSKDSSRKKYRAAIVFFESITRMNEFRKSEFFRQVIENTSVNMLSENTTKDARDYIIKKAATAGQVTLATKVFGRGTDFISRDTELNNRGGTHIVQTFLSEMLSEEVQVQGRTSRQGQKGSYSLVLLAEDDLEESLGPSKKMILVPRLDTLQHFDIGPDDIGNQSRGERYRYLCQKRNERRETESIQIEDNLSVASSRDTLTRSYFASLLSSQIPKARSLFEQIYIDFKGAGGQQQVGIHVIFMLDESGSMSNRPYQELRQAYGNFVSQRLVKEGTDNDALTVITFDSVARTICTMAPFTSAPSLPYRGGGTSFCPPLANAEVALRTAEGSGLLPVLVLMTDGGCSDINEAAAKMQIINEKYEKDNLQVHLVAFGSGASISNLEAIRNRCDDGHIHTAALGDLTATFKDIEQSIFVPEYNCV